MAGKITKLRDYSLVALLMCRGHQIKANGDGSFTAIMPTDVFVQEEQEYRLRWKPVLDTIKSIKKEISSSRLGHQKG